MSIARLADTDVRLINSGQVVTDVTGIVKELLENSLDAGATSINITLDGYGLDQIVVKDNGIGIPAQDRHLLAKSHYTSKLRAFQDLQAVRTYGFRGEALASFVELCASVTLTTRTCEDDVAQRYSTSSRGLLLPIMPTADPVGTTVCVTKPWAKLPVRRQAHRKQAARVVSKVRSLVQAYSLVKPAVRFHLVIKSFSRNEPPTLWTSVPKNSMHEVARSIFGPPCVDDCMRLEIHIDGFSFEALLPCSGGRGAVSRCGQFLFIDDRPMSCIRDFPRQMLALIKGSVTAACPSLGNSSVIVVNIKCPEGSYDPNIEPAKDMVMFEEPHRVLAALTTFLQRAYTPSETRVITTAQGLMPASKMINIATEHERDSALPDRVSMDKRDLDNSGRMCVPDAAEHGHEQETHGHTMLTQHNLQTKVVDEAASTDVLEDHGLCSSVRNAERPYKWKRSMLNDEVSSDEDPQLVVSSSNVNTGVDEPRMPTSNMPQEESEEEKDFVPDRPSLTNPWTIAGRCGQVQDKQLARARDPTAPMTRPGRSSKKLSGQAAPAHVTKLHVAKRPSGAPRSHESQSMLYAAPSTSKSRSVHTSRGQSPESSSVQHKRIRLDRTDHVTDASLSQSSPTRYMTALGAVSQHAKSPMRTKLYYNSSVDEGDSVDNDSRGMVHDLKAASGLDPDLRAGGPATDARRVQAGLYETRCRALDHPSESEQTHNLSCTIKVSMESIIYSSSLGQSTVLSGGNMRAGSESLLDIDRLEAVGSELGGGLQLVRALDGHASCLALFVASGASHDSRDSFAKLLERQRLSDFRDLKLTGDTEGLLRLW